MKLVTLALRPLTVGRSAAKQWEKRMNILHAQGPVHTDCSAVLISEWMHFMLSMNLSGFWRRGLGALDMLEPFWPCLRSDASQPSHLSEERRWKWKTWNLNEWNSHLLCRFVSFVSFLQGFLFFVHVFFNRFLSTWILWSAGPPEADRWSGCLELKACCEAMILRTFFFRFFFLCGIFLLHLRGLWNGAGIVGWPGCAEAWEFWIWSLAHPFPYALRPVGWIKTWCPCGQGVSNLLSPNWSRMATRHWTQWKLSHAKLSAYTPEAGECRLKCSVLASSP